MTQEQERVEQARARLTEEIRYIQLASYGPSSGRVQRIVAEFEAAVRADERAKVEAER